MFEQEFIKVFDDLLPYTVLDECPSVGPGEKHHFSDIKASNTLDNTLFETTKEIITLYKSLNPQLVEKWVTDTGDGGFLVSDPRDTGPRYADQLQSNGRVLFTIIYFTSEDRVIEFPHQRLKVRGKAGRAVVFPSYNTHPFVTLGHGPIIVTHIVFPDANGHINVEDIT